MKSKGGIRPEIIVFAAILAFVIILSLLVNVPPAEKQSTYEKAPELAGISGWINTEPFSLAQLRGKVVLVDFWTYSCINCIRTLPYLKSWHEKYANDFVIVGVHTPEFEFEKDYSNVVNAVNRYGLKYRVVQDNDYATWRAYKNQFWPRKYLIDKDGFVRYDHIGEGGYEETEKMIVQLLKEAAAAVNEKNVTIVQQEQRLIGTPEMYLGYNFARAPLGNAEGFRPGELVEYQQAEPALRNIIYLAGAWQNNADHMKSSGPAAVTLVYQAKDVNIVASGPAKLQIFVDGKAAGALAGIDATSGIVNITDSRLYNIVSGGYGSHRLDILVAEGSLRLYSFTFG